MSSCPCFCSLATLLAQHHGFSLPSNRWKHPFEPLAAANRQPNVAIAAPKRLAVAQRLTQPRARQPQPRPNEPVAGARQPQPGARQPFSRPAAAVVADPSSRRPVRAAVLVRLRRRLWRGRLLLRQHDRRRRGRHQARVGGRGPRLCRRAGHLQQRPLCLSRRRRDAAHNDRRRAPQVSARAWGLEEGMLPPAGAARCVPHLLTSRLPPPPFTAHSSTCSRPTRCPPYHTRRHAPSQTN